MAASEGMHRESGPKQPRVSDPDALEFELRAVAHPDQSQEQTSVPANEGPSLSPDPPQGHGGANDQVPAGSQRDDRVGQSAQAEERRSRSRAKLLRGKKVLFTIQVKQQENLLTRLFYFYVVMLRMPLPAFLLCMVTGPILLSLLFTPLYLVDVESLKLEDDGYRSSEWASALESVLGRESFRVFFYSLSLSTTLGGGNVEARSPYTILVANLNTLSAQLIFVFLSGAVFQRLSQPRPYVRFAKMALLTEDRLADAFSNGEERKPYKAFLTRLVLAGSGATVLINAKFDLLLRRIVTVPGQSSPFVMSHSLPLVRSEASYLRYGMLLRHVIDESSPLWGRSDHETLNEEDASFEVSVSAIERSSMQPVFGNFLYSVYDGDVVWDGEYEDLITMDPRTGKFQMNQTKLNKLRPKREPAPQQRDS